ncbi:MAG: hypothetical protein KKF30_06050 [Proteobacteria bacterium]|nr:hypothetical protein [Pseudomonadota bacterium]MBU4471255.1 hypothetical protein [Pseudomonadota bacterium]MCG2752856.1 hypothetical protein [Desulfobacteraceae bacterium]
MIILWGLRGMFDVAGFPKEVEWEQKDLPKDTRINMLKPLGCMTAGWATRVEKIGI